MKKFLFLCLFVIASETSFSQGFEVKKFTADFFLNQAGYFDVVEKYNINFIEAKHGILRDIITQYEFTDETGKVSKREIYISNIEVPGQNFSTNMVFGRLWDKKLSIKIGDKNKLVSGEQHYEIRYRVKNALILNKDNLEFYWNIKSSEWMAIFNEINFNIHVPDGIKLSTENCFVYAGNAGITKPSAEFDYNYSENTFATQSKEGFISVPGQSVTALVRLPESSVQQVDFTPPIWKRYDWLGYILLFIFSVWAFVKIKLRINKITPITSYYPPKGIDPAMAGILIDDLAQTRDISCLLPYWATKGIIHIEEISKGGRSALGELKLKKLKELPGDSADYEFNLFNKIFAGRDEVRTGQLFGIFREPLQLLNKASKKYYNSKTNTLKIIVLILSWLWAFFSISGLPFVVKPYIDIESGKFIDFVIINFIFFFLVFPFLFAYIFNKVSGKTAEGRTVMAELLGFHQFVKLADARRIRVLLEQDPLYFEKTMPYAIAFNFLNEWTDNFEGLINYVPEWYGHSSGTGFNMSSFAASFSGALAKAGSTMVSSPSRSSSSSGRSSSSSGGGSSGGGFGGGGGGSW